jgi:hypothetical protein
MVRLPPPRRRVNQGKFAPAGWGCPEVAVWQKEIPPRREIMSGAFKNPLNLKTGFLPRFTLLLGGGRHTGEAYIC